jgi:hypothetical protein
MSRQKVDFIYIEISNIISILKSYERKLDDKRAMVLMKLEGIFKIVRSDYEYNKGMKELSDKGYRDYAEILIKLLDKMEEGASVSNFPKLIKSISAFSRYSSSNSIPEFRAGGPVHANNKNESLLKDEDIYVEIYRDPLSYKTINNQNFGDRGKDEMKIFNRKKGECLLIPITSVPTMPNTSINDALAPGLFELTLGPIEGSKYSPCVMTISSGTLISGETLNSEGITKNNKVPWRVHDTLYFGSEGCLVGQKNNTQGSVVNIIETLKSWGIKYNDKIKGYLYDK